MNLKLYNCIKLALEMREMMSLIWQFSQNYVSMATYYILCGTYIWLYIAMVASGVPAQV